MEESQEILLSSLASSGVSIPRSVSSIQDLTPTSLFSICAQALSLIDNSTSFPTSLPDSMAERFKTCTEISSAVKSLGYIGDMSFHKVNAWKCSILLFFLQFLSIQTEVRILSWKYRFLFCWMWSRGYTEWSWNLPSTWSKLSRKRKFLFMCSIIGVIYNLYNFVDIFSRNGLISVASTK